MGRQVIFSSQFAGVVNQRTNTFGTVQTGQVVLRSRNGSRTADGNLIINPDGEARITTVVLSGYTIHGTAPKPRGNEYDVEWTVSNFIGNDDPVMGLARMLDENNYYAGSIRNGGANPDQRLVKCVAGVITSLGTANIGETAPVACKLEIRDATKKLFTGGVQRISSADNALTDAGEAGIGWGNLVGVGGDDADPGVRISELIVTQEAGDVSANINGDLGYSVSSPAQITANQASYALNDAVIHRLSTDASRTLFGIVAPANNRRNIIINVGSNDLVLAHESGSAGAAAQRIVSPNGADETLQADGVAELVYDSTSQRHRITSI
jgi:hypothetical protein